MAPRTSFTRAFQPRAALSAAWFGSHVESCRHRSADSNRGFAGQSRSSVRWRCDSAARGAAAGVLVALLCLARIAAADPAVVAADSSRLTRYLQKDSPLTRIEAILGITHRESIHGSRLTGLSARTPAAMLGSAGRFSRQRLFSGWGEVRSGAAFLGVAKTGASNRFLGVSLRHSLGRLFGVTSAGGSSGLGRFAFMRGSRSMRILPPALSASRTEKWFGFRSQSSTNNLLGRDVWRPQKLYGRNNQWRTETIFGRSLRSTQERGLYGVSARSPREILDRGGNRRSIFSGRRLFGL